MGIWGSFQNVYPRNKINIFKNMYILLNYLESIFKDSRTLRFFNKKIRNITLFLKYIKYNFKTRVFKETESLSENITDRY